MRSSNVATLGLLLLGAIGCASSHARVLPRHGLLARTRAGFEPPTTARASAAVSFAAAQIGKPYCWGGTGPACFDCSGLAQTAWGWAGVPVPRTTGRIAESLMEVDLAEVRAGDILWWPGHVGIYAGNGWMIDALDSHHGVVVRPASDPYRAFRPFEPTAPGGAITLPFALLPAPHEGPNAN
jgi:cell wall-associated NlpC family hydrolase